MTITVRNPPPPNGHTFFWDNITDADNAADACSQVASGDRTVQVFGTWGTAKVEWQGSLDGEHWATLKDPWGVPLTFTADGLGLIIESPTHVKPVVTEGAGYNLTAVMSVRR